MGFIELLQFRPFQERRIPTEDHGRPFCISQQVPGLEHRMAGAQLFFLDCHPGPGPQKFRHLFGTEAHDHDLVVRPCFVRCVQHMFQHGLAAQFMQDLGELGFHPGPLSCRQDNCRQICHSSLPPKNYRSSIL